MVNPRICPIIEAGGTVYGGMLNLAAWVKSETGEGSPYRNQHQLVAHLAHWRPLVTDDIVRFTVRWLWTIRSRILGMGQRNTSTVVSGGLSPTRQAIRLLTDHRRLSMPGERVNL